MSKWDEIQEELAKDKEFQKKLRKSWWPNFWDDLGGCLYMAFVFGFIGLIFLALVKYVFGC